MPPKHLIRFLALIFSTIVFAQSGPGGIGNGDGTNGPRNVLWLDASTLSLTNNDPVTVWSDQSGNGNDLTQQATDAVPFFRNDGIDGATNVVRFDGSERYLTIADNATLDGFTGGVSIFLVVNFSTVDGSPRGIISKRNNSSSGEAYSIFTYSGSRVNFDVRTGGDNRLAGSTGLSNSTNYILSSIYDNQRQYNSVLSAIDGTRNVSGNLADANSDLILGALNDAYGTYFDGDLAEVIVYGDGLTQAERIVVENYLSTRYGINIAASGNDHWPDPAGFSNDLAGIGQEPAYSSEAVSAQSDLITISESDDLDDNDWVFWGHDGADATAYTATEIVTGSSQMRLAREWLVEETNDAGMVTVSIAESDLPSNGLSSADFYLLVDTDGDFTNATSHLMSLNSGNYEVTLNLSDGDYLTIAYEPLYPAGVAGDLAFWFSSQQGVENSGSTATDGQTVTTWQDLSVNNADGQNGTSPTFRNSTTVNYHPIVAFDAGSNQYLEFDLTGLESTNYTLFSVVQRSSSGTGYVLGSQDNQPDAFWLGYSANTQLDVQNANSATANATVSAFDNPISSPALIAASYNGSTLDLDEFRDGAIASGNISTSTDYAANGYTGNLGRALVGNYFDGDVLEVIAYSAALSTTEYDAIASYLSIKYGINRGTDFVDEQANLLWDLSDNTGYTNDVAAIGYDVSFDIDQRISGAVADSVVLATNADFSSLNESTSRTQLTDGQFVFVSHDGDPVNLDQSYNGVANSRLDRTWLIREIASPGEVVVALPSTAADVNTMIVSTDPAFGSGNTVVALKEQNGYLYARYDFADGDFFTFVSDASEVWYSYLSGNWSDPGNWTLDGAVSALYVNPSAKTPAPGDSVVIKSGRNITADINNIGVEHLELTGTLDLGATTGHNFGYIKGSGNLQLSGASGADNYPDGIDTLFYDDVEGGTVIYQGTGLTLDQDRTYNNVVIDLNADTDVATQLASAISINGNLTITQGIYQINDNSTSSDLMLDVGGDLSIASTGGMDVGSANARHELNLYGDFTNQGEAYFTNRTSQNTGSEATDGIIDVNFVSDTQDQLVDLQNITHFYRIEVNKGVDDTYQVAINADDPSYFELFGRANQNHGNKAQLSPAANENLNAVGLYYGTLVLGNNVDVGVLNTGGNYNISEGAKLVLNGGSAAKNGGTAIVLYGTTEVNSGTLSAPINSGITNRANGQLVINGGTVTVNQFRTSVNGASAQGGLIMTGGIFNITGGTTSTNYYTFSLTYEGNVFNMSGGVINLSGVNNRGGVYINSADENISVTGGTVNLDVTNGNDLTITSRAPFFNLNILRSAGGGTGDVMIAAGNSGNGGAQTALTPDGLTILNDLKIDNSDGHGTPFSANGFDVDITGSLIIENGAAVDITGMELTFEGNGASTFDIQTGATLQIDTLIINKELGLTALDISNGAATAIQINNLLQVINGNFDLATFAVAVLGEVVLNDTVGVSGSTGILAFNGTAAQQITSSEGMIYDLVIDNANGVSLSGDLAADSLSLNGGIFDISTSKLQLNSEVQTTGTFSSSLMIQTAGNASDGGLEYYFDGNTADPLAYLYPLGTNANSTVRYTPANLNLSGIADDGYIQIRTSDTELQTVDLSALSSNLLTYYWRVGHAGFTTLPTVEQLDFTADDADDPDSGATPGGLPTDFVPGKVLDQLPFTRSQENTSDISGLTITFDGSGSGFTLEKANYTAGDGTTSLFSGTPEVYYTADRNTQFPGRNWNANGTWSTVGHYSTTNNGTYPQTGDVVFIGFSPQTNDQNQRSHWIVMNVDVDVAQITFQGDSVLNNSGVYIQRNASFTPQLTIRDNRGTVNLGVISGRGTFNVEVDCSTCNADPDVSVARTATINADFGEFADNPDSRFDYDIEFNNNISVKVPTSFPEEYPNVHVKGGNGNNRRLIFQEDLLINQDLTIRQSATLQLHHGANGDIEVMGNLDMTINAEADKLEFPTSGTARTFTLHGNVEFRDGDGDAIEVLNTTPSGLVHRFRLGGSIDQQSGNTIDLFTDNTGGNNVILELFGDNTASYTTGNNNMSLYRLEMNKGSDTTSSFTFDDHFTLGGPVDADPQALVLENGKLVLNDPTINLQLTDGVDYSIPSSAGLEVSQGTVTAADATLLLNGLLRVNGGTVDLTNTHIEYSTTGAALIDVTSGSLQVGYQVRRSTSSTTGVLKYRQSGGDVDIATNGAPVSNRGAFEILNTGSELMLTGGTFNVERGVTGDTNESIELAPDSYDLTGSTITIYENLGANYGTNYFNLKTNIPLDDLTIANSIDLPDVRLYTQPLTVNALTINSNQTLLTNGFELTVKGDFVNNGTYTNSTAVTRLAPSASQSISGSGTFTIDNLIKSATGTTNTAVDLTVNKDLRVLGGTLNIGTNSINLKGNAYVESVLANSSGNGLIFNGNAKQNLHGTSNSTVTLGTVTVNNSSGVDIPDGNGYDFDITDELRLAGGVFNIGGSLVTMKRGSAITEVSTFGLNNMVQTNSSFTDNGMVIEFYDVAVDTSIFFPIGELKYTPVKFDLQSGATQGNIRVRPANEPHPSVIDNTEPGTETEIDDTQNALQYYWVVVAENTTGVQGSARFFYSAGDAQVTAPYDTAHYISGRVLANGTTWDKFDPSQFKGGLLAFDVPLDQGSGVTSTEITGDYTAGVGSSDGVNNDIEGALPDEIAEYETNFSGSGDYSSASNWTPLNGAPSVTNGVGPVGAKVTLQNGATLNLDISNVRLYSTEIESGGKISVPAGSTGNRLGTVTGSGTIQLTDTELLPTGEYTSFLACDGGALQYSGSTAYNVLSGIPQIRKVVFDGAGTRHMPNNNLTVCDTLLIDGPTVAFSSGKTRTIGDTDDDKFLLQSGSVSMSNATAVVVNGDFEVSGGSFTGGSGTSVSISDDLSFSGGSLSWNGTAVTLNGTTEQLMDGNFIGVSGFNNLAINNSSAEGIRINSGDVVVKGVLNLTDGVFQTNSSETLTLTSSASYSNASADSYISGPMTKNAVNVASSYIFPVGKSSRYAPGEVVGVGTGGQNWTCEYFTTTGGYPYSSFDDQDPGSGFNALTGVSDKDRWEITSSGSNNAQIRLSYGTHINYANQNNLRVVWWDGVDARWENQGGIVTGSYATGQVRSENVVGFSTQQFSLGTGPESTLPVELLDFFATVLPDGKVKLQWATASEIDNDRFEIERSANGVDFEMIGQIAGAGNANELNEYSYVDEQPYFGVSYYRLRQVDYDGQFEYFPLIRVDNKFKGKTLNVTLFPNPAISDFVTLNVESGNLTSDIQITVFDALGRIYYQEAIEPAEASFSYQLKLNSGMTNGVYYVQIRQGKDQQISRLIRR